MNTAAHQGTMKRLSKIREVRVMNREITQLNSRQLKETLREKHLSTRGDIAERQDRLLRASLREADFKREEIPWYEEDAQRRASQASESTSESETEAVQKPKKRRGRKPKVPQEVTEDSAFTTDEGAGMSSGVNDVTIHNTSLAFEPVTSTSGLSARGTTTASYVTASMPQLVLSSASNATTSLSESLPVTATAQRDAVNPLRDLQHCISVAPELQEYWTSKAKSWQMSTLGVQYVQTITTPRRSAPTEDSPGHGVSSTQPAPAPQLPTVLDAAPSSSRQSPPQPRTLPDHTTLSVHKGLYADGWKNGEGSSSEDEEVDAYTSARLTQIATRLARSKPRKDKHREESEIQTQTDASIRPRHTPQRKDVAPPRRKIQEEFSERSQPRTLAARTRGGSERDERESTIPTAKGRHTQQHRHTDDVQRDRSDRESSLARSVKSQLSLSGHRREAAAEEDRRRRRDERREEEMRRSEEAERRIVKPRRERTPERGDRRRKERRRKSHTERRHRRRSRSSSESSLSSGSSDDYSSDSSGHSSEEEPRRSRRRRRNASRDWKARREVQAWRIQYSGEDKEGPEEFLTMLTAWRKKSSMSDRDLLRALPSILSKSALRWYLTTQDDITTWHEFKKEFRLQFIGALDKTDIEEELHARTQAKGENITNFLSCFRYIVGHFKRPPPERKLVKIAYKNILPEYRAALFDKKVNSLQMIKEYGVKLERQMEIDRRHTPPKPKDKMKLQGAAFVRGNRTAKVVAAVELDGDRSSSDDEGSRHETKRKGKKKGKTLSRAEEKEEVAAVEAKKATSAGPMVPTPSPAALAPTATPAPISNTAQYGPNGGDQRRGRGRYDRGANFRPPMENGARRNDDGARFVGACYLCDEIGHRADQCPRIECYACRQVGHMAADCPLRPPRPPANVSCQVCGQQGVVFANCPGCAQRRSLWGNGQVGGQNSPLVSHQSPQGQ